MEAISIPYENYLELIKKLDNLTKQFESKLFINPLPDRWLDIQETCIVLNVSKRTLQTYRDTGILSFSQIGSKIYYKAADIQSHLEKHYNPAFRLK
jgi:hypothetical protein